MSKSAHRIKSVTATASPTQSTYLLRVEWASGSESTVDLADTIARVPFFAPLKAPELFCQAKVGEWGWDVTWPGGIDMAADRLLSLGLEQSGRADNAKLREWMWSNQLTLTEAANALGMTTRSISAYGTGKRPVPRYISLACKGWEVERRALKA